MRASGAAPKVPFDVERARAPAPARARPALSPTMRRRVAELADVHVTTVEAFLAGMPVSRRVARAIGRAATELEIRL